MVSYLWFCRSTENKCTDQLVDVPFAIFISPSLLCTNLDLLIQLNYGSLCMILSYLLGIYERNSSCITSIERFVSDYFIIHRLDLNLLLSRAEASCVTLLLSQESYYSVAVKSELGVLCYVVCCQLYNLQLKLFLTYSRFCYTSNYI